MNLPATLLAATLVLSGCLAGPDDPADLEAEPTPRTHAFEAPQVLEGEGRIGAGAGAALPTGYQNLEILVSQAMRFSIAANTSALVVELVWPDEPIPNDLTLWVRDPSDDIHRVIAGRPAAPDRPSLRFEAPAEGAWTTGAHASGVTVSAEYRSLVTVFQEGTAPEGYTAVHDGPRSGATPRRVACRRGTPHSRPRPSSKPSQALDP